MMEQPRFGQRDYATSRFSIVEDGVERAVISFEVVIYSDRHTAQCILWDTWQDEIPASGQVGTGGYGRHDRGTRASISQTLRSSFHGAQRDESDHALGIQGP